MSSANKLCNKHAVEVTLERNHKHYNAAHFAVRQIECAILVAEYVSNTPVSCVCILAGFCESSTFTTQRLENMQKLT